LNGISALLCLQLGFLKIQLPATVLNSTVTPMNNDMNWKSLREWYYVVMQEKIRASDELIVGLHAINMSIAKIIN
jgi:hypothetical protein